MNSQNTLLIGASSDIGLELIRQIDARERHIIAHYNSNAEALDTLSSRVKSKVTMVNGDLSTEAGCDSFIKKTALISDTFQEIVVMPATPLRLNRFKEIKRSQVQRDIDLQVYASLDILNAFLPRMVAQKSGSIVFILSSVTLSMPPPSMGDYTIVKHAQLGLMRALASEYGNKGIRVNAVSPSMIETKFIDKLPRLVVEINKEKHPMGCNAQACDVAPLIAFLLSDAGRYLNGVNIPVTGGTHV